MRKGELVLVVMFQDRMMLTTVKVLFVIDTLKEGTIARFATQFVFDVFLGLDPGDVFLATFV